MSGTEPHAAFDYATARARAEVERAYALAELWRELPRAWAKLFGGRSRVQTIKGVAARLG